MKPDSSRLRFFGMVLGGRRLVVGLSLVVTALLLPGVTKVRFDSTSDGSVPRNDPHLAYFEEVKADYGNDQVGMVVLVRNDDLGAFHPDALAKIAALTDSLSALDGVDDVVSLTNTRFLSGIGGDELTNDLIIPEIPQTLEEARRLRAEVLGNPLFHHTIVSPDGQAAALNVFLENEPDYVLVNSGVNDRIVELTAAFAGPEKTYYSGLINTRMTINRMMKSDLGRLIPVAFVLIILILLAALRSPVSMVVPSLTIVMALGWTFGLIGHLGQTISLTTTIIPPLMIAIGCSLSIHILTGVREHLGRGLGAQEAVLEAFSEQAPPLLTAGLTTAVGFGSLMVSSIPNIQKVGVFAVLGVFSVLWISFTFVPAALALVPRLQPKSDRLGSISDGHEERKRDILVDALVGFNLRHSRAVLVVTGVIMLVCLAGLVRIQVDTEFLSYFKEDSDIRQAADIIGKNLAGVSTFYVIAESDSTDAMREGDVLRGLERLQARIEAMPSIDKTSSMVNVIQLWHQAINNDEPDSLKIPATQEDLDAAIFLTIDQEEPAVRAHHVVEDYSAMSIFVRSQLVSTSDLAKAIEEIETLGREFLPPWVKVRATGTVVIFAKTITALVDSQRDSLGLAFLLVFLVMSGLFRSPLVGLVAMISNVIPILVIFGIMGWFGISLNLGTSIVASISLGIAVDDTIHYLMNYRGAFARSRDRRQAMAEALRRVTRPIIFTSIALALGFSVLCASDFGLLFAVGALSAMTMVTCLISDLFLTSALILTFDFGRNIKTIPTSQNLE